MEAKELKGHSEWTQPEFQKLVAVISYIFEQIRMPLCHAHGESLWQD